MSASPLTVLNTLLWSGAVLELVAGTVKLKVPSGTITPDLRTAAVASRAGLARLLADRERCSCGAELDVRETATYRQTWCGGTCGYFRLVNKRDGQPMGRWVAVGENATCPTCGARDVTTYGGKCWECLEREDAAQDREQAVAEEEPTQPHVAPEALEPASLPTPPRPRGKSARCRGCGTARGFLKPAPWWIEARETGTVPGLEWECAKCATKESEAK